MQPILELDGLEHTLRDKTRPETFVVRVDRPLVLYGGDFAALLGPSGCGKSTLLTIVGLLRAPTDPNALRSFRFCRQTGCSGEDVDLRGVWASRRMAVIEEIRRQHMGFALQSGELLPALTVSENIEAPLRLNGWPSSARKQRVSELIEAFGLVRHSNPREARSEDRSNGSRVQDLGSARANRLSGGEYQRVSLARAIAHRPQLIFVDEPTAALNRELARSALEQFRQMLAAGGGCSAALMITHDETLAKEFANVVIHMEPLRNEAGGHVCEIERR